MRENLPVLALCVGVQPHVKTIVSCRCSAGAYFEMRCLLRARRAKASPNDIGIGGITEIIGYI